MLPSCYVSNKNEFKSCTHLLNTYAFITRNQIFAWLLFNFSRLQHLGWHKTELHSFLSQNPSSCLPMYFVGSFSSPIEQVQLICLSLLLLLLCFWFCCCFFFQFPAQLTPIFVLISQGYVTEHLLKQSCCSLESIWTISKIKIKYKTFLDLTPILSLFSIFNAWCFGQRIFMLAVQHN